ncbi:MAG: hypothetical protein A3H49_08315 [Nitrospirae bacterium RIFCSPLOWO2_02_FULL_62_14]|nr:MAG: hypothetical protein A3H49_08315 [Nitrospirae bacterium RIFCSPLOWO2_02_FULL_62_14]
MTILEVAALIVAVAFAALVGFLVPVLLQVKKAVAEVEQSFIRINTEMLPLLTEMRATMANLNELVEKTRDGVDHASILLHTAGEIGESVQQFHDMVRGTGGALLRNVVNMVFAGIQAATAVFSGRGSPRNS